MNLGDNDMWFEGDVCGDCNHIAKNNEKKDEIERILIDKWKQIGMDIPANYEDIVQDCYEDVHDTADPVDWNDGDVAIAFRRWIEKQI
jgi:hypothetical protein